MNEPIMDIVIPVGTGSKWENNELRYALRGIEMHVKNYRDIWIIGEKPAWVTGVKHIAYSEPSTINHEKNIYDKLIAACDHAEISDDFAMWNDDFFAIGKIDVNNIPFYQKGQLYNSIIKFKMGDKYRYSLHNSMWALEQRGHTSFHFDTHWPIIYNKEKFRLVVGSYDWEGDDHGFVIKSLYCNTLGISGPYKSDCKIDKPFTIWQLKQLIKNRTLFSIGDRGINDAMKELLAELFPKASKYEKAETTERLPTAISN